MTRSRHSGQRLGLTNAAAAGQQEHDGPRRAVSPARYGDPKQSDPHFTIVAGVNHVDILLRSRKQGLVVGAGPAVE